MLKTKFILAFTVFSGLAAAAADAGTPAPKTASRTAEEVIRQVTAHKDNQGEKVQVSMKLLGADGSERDAARTFVLQASYSSNGDSKTLITFLSPRGILGTKILTLKSGDETGQWIYLPSVRKASRINSDQDVEGILDSDLSYSDIKEEDVKEYNYSFATGEAEAAAAKNCGGPAYAIAATSRSSGSGYSKRLLSVSKDKLVICGVTLFDGEGKRVKDIVNKSFKKVGGNWRPSDSQVVSLKPDGSPSSKTLLEYSGWQVGAKLDAGLFTVNNLSK